MVDGSPPPGRLVARDRHPAASWDVLFAVQQWVGDCVGAGVSFWDDKKAPAVLKHSVLRRYLRVFAPKVASRARDRRVVYVDAFAGPGRYEDGSAASPAIAMELSGEMAGWTRNPVNLDCVFIEKKKSIHQELCRVVPPERAWHGSAERKLGAVLERARGQPLFMFIDPYGQPIPFEDVTGRLLARPQGPGLATEVLTNFSVVTLQRVGGRLEQRKQRDHASSVLERFDRAMGGAWWHEQGRRLAQSSDADDQERASIERSLVAEYARRISEHSGYEHIVAPVWRRGWKEHRPFFYLVFHTVHPQGLWFYVDALASAMDDYYAATHPEMDDLFDRPEVRRRRASETVRSNIVNLVEEGPFEILDRTLAVMDGAVGDAGSGEVARAVKALEKRDEIRVEGSTVKSRIHEAVIHPGTAISLFD